MPVGPHILQMEIVRRHAAEFDILHFHTDYWPASLFWRQPTPFVTTVHGRLDLRELPAIWGGLPPISVVSISDAQREPLPQANFIATVHHGMPETLLTPVPVQPSYLAFLGRISPEKGPDAAIRIARRAGLPLKIAAKVDKADQEYFDTVIRPLLAGPGVELVGEIGDDRKADFLSGAIALLTPIDWPEPFGLVMIEAMACGTPVIAFNRGSVPEIIENDVTGFAVDDVDAALNAIGRLGTLSRPLIRKEFERRFSARRMTEDYLAVYNRLINTSSIERKRALAGD